MTALRPENTRLVEPPEGAAPQVVRPETEMAATGQRGIAECEAIMRECRDVIAEHQVKLERAIERRARLEAASAVVGIRYGE